MNQFYETVDVRLPIGYYDKVNWYDTAIVREFTARDNEILTSNEAAHNGAKAITSLIQQLVVGLRNSTNPEVALDRSKITKDLVRAMYIADRDAIVLACRKLSLGNEIRLNFKCRNCEEQAGFEYPLDDVETKYAEHFPPSVEFGVVLKRGLRSGEEVFKDVTMTHLKGHQLEEVTPIVKTNPSRGAIMMIFKQIVQVPGMENAREPVSLAMLQSLPQIDIGIFQKTMGDNIYGPDLQPTVDCGFCGTETRLPLDVYTLFRSE
jgi:hypothetical protein